MFLKANSKNKYLKIVGWGGLFPFGTIWAYFQVQPVWKSSCTFEVCYSFNQTQRMMKMFTFVGCVCVFAPVLTIVLYMKVLLGKWIRNVISPIASKLETTGTIPVISFQIAVSSDTATHWHVKEPITLHIYTHTRWWFETFFIFTPTWGRFPFWLIFFRWLETTN